MTTDATTTGTPGRRSRRKQAVSPKLVIEEWNAELDNSFRLIYARPPAVGDELMEPDATVYRFTGPPTGWVRPE